jgi:signal transduction histidine kinase
MAKTLMRGKSVQGAQQGAQPRAIVVGDDPYIAFLIRLYQPPIEAIDVAHLTPDVISTHRPDLVVIGGDISEPLAALGRSSARPKVLAVVDASSPVAETPPAGVDRLVARPFTPADLHEAIAAVLGQRRATRGPRPSRRGALARARRATGIARLVALGVAAVLASGGVQAQHTPAILALALAYGTLRLIINRGDPVWSAADVVAGGVLVAVGGGPDSVYTIFAVVNAAAVGLWLGPQAGVLAGVSIFVCSVPASMDEFRSAGASALVAWAVLLPLAGLSGGYALRFWEGEEAARSDLVGEANRVLTSLYRIARALPGGLDVRSVADATVAELAEALQAPAGGVLLGEGTSFHGVSAYGMDKEQLHARIGVGALGEVVSTGGSRVVTRDQMTPDQSRALDLADCWIAAAIRHEGTSLGLMIAACSNHAQHSAMQAVLRRLAGEAAVAIHNAKLFARLRDLSADEERRRLARELHDGLAQVLTHLRFELDFMARQMPADATDRGEVERLVRVVEHASQDVRSLISGLRSPIPAGEGLGAALGSYVADLRSLGGPQLRFETSGTGNLSPEAEAECFRIAQEAVSNAMRHSGANVVRVSLEMTPESVRLVVSDDGTGLGGPSAAAGDGIGLGAMSERASKIGGTLSVDASKGEGTMVELVVPAPSVGRES